jgi:hypothetical protein
LLKNGTLKVLEHSHGFSKDSLTLFAVCCLHAASLSGFP